MKRLFVLFCSSLLSINSALAVNTATGTGLTPVIVFRSHAARTTEIDLAPAANFTNVDDDVFDFIPVNGDNNAADYLNSNGAYTLSPPAASPAPPTPNVTGFITAVNADPLGTANNGLLIFQMAGLLAIFQADMMAGNVTALQGHWANAILLYGPNGSQGNWLTATVQAMLLGYANTYAIPLANNQ